jgi:hypothetical protein
LARQAFSAEKIEALVFGPAPAGFIQNPYRRIAIVLHGKLIITNPTIW